MTVTYYLNPKQVSDQAKIFPQFETINPLGLTVTEFHENRLSVDPIAPGTTGPMQSLAQPSPVGRFPMSYHLILPFFPDELRELLLDPSISDLMINGTTGVFADRNGVVQHIPLASPYTNDRLAGGNRACSTHLGTRSFVARIRSSIRACRTAPVSPSLVPHLRSMARR